MSEFFLMWNGLGDAWLEWLVERSIVNAVTLVLVGAVILSLCGRVSAHMPSRLLLLPLIVLVLPLERALPRSWPEPLPAVSGSLFDQAPAISDLTRGPVAGSGPFDTSRFEHSAPATDQAVAPPQSSSLGAPGVVMVAWALFILLGTIRMLVCQRRTDRTLRRSSRAADHRTVRLFERLCRSRSIDDAIELRTSPRLRSPVVTGMFRPIVYLPTGLEARLSIAQLRFVLLHELEHARRRDVLTEALIRIVRLAWIFHPGVWIASAAIARWREYACDEAALAHAGTTTRTPIAEALVTLIDDANDAPHPTGAIAHLLSTREFMKNRLTRILDRSIAPRRRLSPSSAVALVLVCVGALTAARAQQASPQAVSADAELDVALDQATTWLLRSQQADGRWAIGPDPAGEDVRDHNDVHVTGLAIRALLPGVRSARQKEIARAVDRGAKFIQSQQREDGCFAGEGPMTVMCGHAQAIRALCAMQRAWPDERRLQAIEAGVRYAELARNPYMGWRYEPRSGDNDSKITSLMLLALHEASDLGVEVDEDGIRHGRSLLTQLTDEDTGRTGFVRRGQAMPRFSAKKQDFPGELSEEPTAMKLLVDLASGEELADSKSMRRAVELLVERPPEWSTIRGSIDYSYWNFGAHAMATVGGFQAEIWRERLRTELIPHCIVEDDAAHWPAIDAWSHPGMEVYATASAMLTLQALR